MPTDFDQRLGDVDATAQQVDPATAEAEQLARAESAVGAHEDEWPAALVDRVGERHNLARNSRDLRSCVPRS